MAVIAFLLVYQEPDTSFVSQSAKRLTDDANANSKKGVDEAKKPHGVSARVENEEVSHARARKSKTHEASEGRETIKYRAVQVVRREGSDPDKTLPIGTNFIGRLLGAIDTRESSGLVRVILPYGGSFDHERRIDRNSILFGAATYPGNGEKVYVKFNRVLFPDGKEFKIDAQALNAVDYSLGLRGDEHDGAETRIATTMGLTMLSGISEVMVEKEGLGQSAFATPKSSLRNGFYNGLTKSTQTEAERRAAKMNSDKDYVTIEAGRDVIISLTETFKGDAL